VLKAQKTKLIRTAVTSFKKFLRRKIKNKKFDPSDLKNRIETMSYISKPEPLSDSNTMIAALWNKEVGTKITQTYSEFIVRLQLVGSMVKETQSSWKLFNKTQERWMANCVYGPDNQPVNYLRMNALGLQL
jgi:signal recognition particle GTPase